MPIQLIWDDADQTILHQIYTDSFELSDWYEAVSQTCVMLNDVVHPTNIVLDLTKLEQLPVDWIEILSYSKRRYHDKQAEQIIIARPEHMKPLQTLLHAGNPYHGIQIVATKAEARRIFRNNLQAAIAS